MTVKSLRTLLDELGRRNRIGDDTQVVLSSDCEGTSFGRLESFNIEPFKDIGPSLVLVPAHYSVEQQDEA